MRQIFLLILLFIVGQWLVKALRRHDAQARNARCATVQAVQAAARVPKVRTAARVLRKRRNSPSR